MTWSEPLNGAIINGQCPQAWIDLLFWVSMARVFDGNRADALYYALLPVGIPIGGAAGCGGPGSGAGSGVSGDGMTMAHELGHVLGFLHAPCGLGAGAASDPNYPAYEPYDTAGAGRRASIGEYGLDVTVGTIYPPNAGKDYMSYCGPRWVSLYHYKALLEHPKLNPTWVSDPHDSLPPYLDEQYHGPSVFDRPDPPPPYVGRRVQLLAEADPIPLIVVTGMLRADEIEVRSLVRVETGPTPSGERIAGAVVEMLDGNGRVLQRAALRHMTMLACGCGGGCAGGGQGDDPPSGLVQAMLPDVEGGTVLRIMRDGEEIWSRQATSEPPTVGYVQADVEGCELRVRWRSSASDAYPLERFVRWSTDDGRHWQALAVKLDEDAATVSTHGLTSGAILVQVTVSDGFHSTNSEPVPVDIPRRAPHAAILWPIEGATVRFDEQLRLWGAATASDGSALPAEAMHWYLDGEAIGHGPEAWVPLPEWEGEHRATLKVHDAHHQHAEASVQFLTSCSGRRPYRSRGSP